ncbi:hypothetical protein [Streptomyces sp. NPDC001851]|uniref:hypothetical protein n=1 Tax=Streptomyces sp. NPDC001851 TaxID=3154529 RepID=UPI0033299166
MDQGFKDDKTTTRAGELRGQSDHLTTALADTEARLADLATPRKTIADVIRCLKRYAPAKSPSPDPQPLDAT